MIVNETFHDEGPLAFDGFCEVDGLSVEGAFTVDGRTHLVGHGKTRLYFLEHIRSTTTLTNPDTNQTITVATVLQKDLKITNNGDGTITIFALGTGNDVVYGPNGSDRQESGQTASRSSSTTTARRAIRTMTCLSQTWGSSRVPPDATTTTVKPSCLHGPRATHSGRAARPRLAPAPRSARRSRSCRHQCDQRIGKMKDHPVTRTAIGGCMYRLQQRLEVRYGHFKEYLELSNQLNELVRARGWTPASFWSPTGNANELIVEIEYPDLATFERESREFGADAEAMKLMRSGIEHIVEGSAQPALRDCA